MCGLIFIEDTKTFQEVIASVMLDFVFFRVSITKYTQPFCPLIGSDERNFPLKAFIYLGKGKCEVCLVKLHHLLFKRESPGVWRVLERALLARS